MQHECPHCHGELPEAGLIARAAERSRLTMRLTPEPGRHLTAETVGGALTNITKLLNAVAANLGGKVVTFIERLTTHEDGTIEIVLLTAEGRDKETADA